MRMYAWAIACFILAAGSAAAQQIIATQPSVARLIHDNDVVHVFTDRVDADYDGEQDEGDLPAQWLIVNIGQQSVVSTYTFPWARVTAKHPALDRATGLMFVGVGDSVWAFTSRTQVRGTEPVFVGSHEAIGYDERSAVLLISQRPSFTDPGSVVVIDLLNKGQTTVGVDVNPQMFDFYRTANNDLVGIVLCEGTFGAADGSIVFLDAAGVTSLAVGDTPNHLLVDDNTNTAYVVLNGSHEIAVIDLDTRTITARWSTGTSGFDGPREIAISTGYAFVTSFSGVLHVFTRHNGQLLASPSLLAKADPVIAVESALWIGHSFETGTYTPTGDVAIYPLNVVSVTDVHTATPSTSISTSADHVELPLFTSGKPLTVTDLQGALVPCTVVGHRVPTLQCSALPAGVYVVTDGTRGILLNIVR